MDDPGFTEGGADWVNICGCFFAREHSTITRIKQNKTTNAQDRGVVMERLC